VKKIPDASEPSRGAGGPRLPRLLRKPARRSRGGGDRAPDGRLSRLVLDRLIRYFWRVAEFAAAGPGKTITSRQLGAALNIDASQIRRDFGAVGLVGMSHVGFDMCEVCRAIRTAVGFDRPFTAVLIGAGNLGRAILSYPGFRRYGLQIVAAFDSDPGKNGEVIAGHTVQPMEELRLFLALHEVRLAILTTPAEASQGLADLFVPAGVRAIWNFTPTRLVVPPGVLTRNEHISVGLSEIAYHLNFPPPAAADGLPAGEQDAAAALPPPGPSIPG
jgi:redox-sensing transcriptional repressor